MSKKKSFYIRNFQSKKNTWLKEIKNLKIGRTIISKWNKNLIMCIRFYLFYYNYNTSEIFFFFRNNEYQLTSLKLSEYERVV